MSPPFYQPTHPPHWRERERTQSKLFIGSQAAPLSYQASPSMLEKQTVYEYFHSLYIFTDYSVFPSENLPQQDTNRSLREVHRYAVVSLSWLIMICEVWGVKCEVVTLSSPGTVLSTTIRAGVECGVTPAQSAGSSHHWNQFRGCHRPTARWWTVMVAIITPEHRPVPTSAHQWPTVLCSPVVHCSPVSSSDKPAFQVVLHFL